MKVNRAFNWHSSGSRLLYCCYPWLTCKRVLVDYNHSWVRNECRYLGCSYQYWQDYEILLRILVQLCGEVQLAEVLEAGPRSWNVCQPTNWPLRVRRVEFRVCLNLNISRVFPRVLWPTSVIYWSFVTIVVWLKKQASGLHFISICEAWCSANKAGIQIFTRFRMEVELR